MRVDGTGKVSLDHIYVQPDPRSYFTTLREFDYSVPQSAKPHFERLIRRYRDARNASVPQILDLGCSYGINAALVKYGATMDELYERYRDEAMTHDILLASDQQFVRSCKTPEKLRFVGLDTSEPALTYALEAGLLDDAVHADFEESEPTEEQAALLAKTDLVISTGCVGYVGEKSFSRLLTAFGERRPWMAHFVLRMFPFEPIGELLAEAGYKTVQLDGAFRQRRFATPQEQALVLDRLAEIGIDPAGRETDGWLYARLYVSTPTRIEEH